MVEFCEPETQVFADSGPESYVTWTVESLLPHAFSPKDLDGTKDAQ